MTFLYSVTHINRPGLILHKNNHRAPHMLDISLWPFSIHVASFNRQSQSPFFPTLPQSIYLSLSLSLASTISVHAIIDESSYTNNDGIDSYIFIHPIEFFTNKNQWRLIFIRLHGIFCPQKFYGIICLIISLLLLLLLLFVAICWIG